MPYKRGPYNTMRKYSQRTGRYEKEDYLTILTTPNGAKTKITQKEKEILRHQNLYNQALNSNDSFLFDVYKALEMKCPGCVKMVNERLYDKTLIKYESREIDIATKNFIIEIKSGKGRSSTTQLISQKNLAEQYGKKFCVFAPKFRNNRKRILRELNIPVFDTTEDLIKEVLL